jgi:3-isopropylmalate/(R)-2-methylmalate dehydratase small subunit
LPITLASNQMDLLFAEVENQPQTQITVDLPTQSIQFGQQQLSFEIAPHHKMNLIKGLDAIGLTLELDPKITEYESRLAPWL